MLPWFFYPSHINFEKIEYLRYSIIKCLLKKVQNGEDYAMNHLYALILITFFSCSMNHATQSIFLGTIQFPSKIESASLYPIFYKGTDCTPKINKSAQFSKKNDFEIYEDRNCNQFHLLVTEKIKWPESADFEFLETEAGYRLFKFTRASKMKELITTDTNHKTVITLEPVEYWNIEELNAHDENGALIIRPIPEDTIILYTNPRFIKSVESEEWKVDDVYFKLPKIIFDDAINDKMLKEVSAKMLFAAIDLRCLHTKVTRTSKPYAQNCIISVRDPLNCYVNNHNTRI